LRSDAHPNHQPGVAMSLTSRFRKWFSPRLTTIQNTRTTVARRRPVRLALELLEDRLAPATLSDIGTSTLSIALVAGEQLGIMSNGTTYTFTTNQSFSATSTTDPGGSVANQASYFNGFTTASLTLTAAGLAHYTDISITDPGSGASTTVSFN